jgi:hypothetical protein
VPIIQQPLSRNWHPKNILQQLKQVISIQKPSSVDHDQVSGVQKPSTITSNVKHPSSAVRCHTSMPNIHGLINYIDTKEKCCHIKNWPVKRLCGRCLSDFIHWRYSQSCRYFRPCFANCCPSNLLSVSTLPPSPLPCVNIIILFTRIQCVSKRVGGYGVLGRRQINTCRKVPLLVNFFRWRHFSLSSMSFIFLRQHQRKTLHKQHGSLTGRKESVPAVY